MKKIALLVVGGLIVNAAFQQGYAQASKRQTPPALQMASVMAYRAGAASAAPIRP